MSSDRASALFWDPSGFRDGLDTSSRPSMTQSHVGRGELVGVYSIWRVSLTHMGNPFSTNCKLGSSRLACGKLGLFNRIII